MTQSSDESWHNCVKYRTKEKGDKWQNTKKNLNKTITSWGEPKSTHCASAVTGWKNWNKYSLLLLKSFLNVSLVIYIDIFSKDQERFLIEKGV